jgi:hypothetical protein
MGDEWPLEISTSGCSTARELSLSPWGIMAWRATASSPRLQPWGDVTEGNHVNCRLGRGVLFSSRSEIQLDDEFHACYSKSSVASSLSNKGAGHIPPTIQSLCPNVHIVLSAM